MKNLSIYFLSLLALLCLTSCQSDPAANTAPVDPSPSEITAPPETTQSATPSEMAQSATASSTIDLDGKTVEEITAAEVVDDYLAGTDRLAVFRSVPIDADEGWLYLEVPSCPNFRVNTKHLYPSPDWTPESVADSYTNSTAPWYSDPNDPLTQGELWSQDYNYHFRIQDGWLYINGHRCLPFAVRTIASIEPSDLLQAYQSGAWDGQSIYSEDYSTQVHVNTDGGLDYCYENPAVLPEDTTANLDYVYTGITKLPWWYAAQDDYAIECFWSASYDDQLAHELISTVDFYIDLPNGTLTGNVEGDLIKHIEGDVIDWFTPDYRNGQTWICTTAGVYLFQRGQEINAWHIPIDATDSYLYNPNWDDNQEYDIYLYTGSQLLQLGDNGQYDVCIAETSSFSTNYETCVYAYFIEDGALKCWNILDSEVSVEEVLPSDVVAATGFCSIFVQMQDGYTYYLADFLQDTDRYYQHDTDYLDCIRLGTESPAYYDAAWRAQTGYFYNFLKSCNPLYPG